MTTIVTRAGKGSPLTHTEVDTNFTNLNTAKLETAAIPLGTLQAPSVSFLNDSDTGIFCPQGGNSLAIATGAQYAITCTSTQAVGIKTANPQKALHVAGATRVGADDATDAFLEIGEGATGNRSSYIDIVGDTTYTDYGLRFIRNNTGANATSEIKHRGTGNLNFTTQEAGAIVFNTTNSPSVTIDSSGRLGIGTSSPAQLFHLKGSGDVKLLLNSSNNASDRGIYFATGTDSEVLGYIKQEYSTGLFEISAGSVTYASGIGFRTGGVANRLVIDSSGRLLVGTADTIGQINVTQSNSGSAVYFARNTSAVSAGGFQVQYSTAFNNTGNEAFYFADGTLRAAIRSNGGLANFQANNVNLSDRNAKKDISPAADTWDCIKEWEIVNYRYKDQPDDADLNLGVIAQQVAESCPEVITVFQQAQDAKPAVLDDEGNEVEAAQQAQPEKLGIKEQQMYWMAIKALQEAQVRIEQLEARLTAAGIE